MYFLNADFNKDGEKSEQYEPYIKARKMPYNKRLKTSPLRLSEKIKKWLGGCVYVPPNGKSPSTKKLNLNKKQ